MNPNFNCLKELYFEKISVTYSKTCGNYKMYTHTFKDLRFFCSFSDGRETTKCTLTPSGTQVFLFVQLW